MTSVYFLLPKKINGAFFHTLALLPAAAKCGVMYLFDFEIIK